MKLLNKRAVITGGARGIGLAIAQRYLAEGASVVVADIDAKAIEDALTTLQQDASAERVMGVVLNVCDQGSIDAMVESVTERFGGIDILVNNAGVAITKPFLDQEPEDYDAVVDTNLRGCFFVAQRVARRMVERGAGSIINIASVLGQDVIGQVTPYCASKAGLLHLTRAMGAELAKTGVRVNAIAPGYIETPMNQAFFQSPAGEKMIARKVPVGRLGAPADLDGALLLLASDASSYMTGTAITVDGGFVLS